MNALIIEQAEWHVDVKWVLAAVIVGLVAVAARRRAVTVFVLVVVRAEAAKASGAARRELQRKHFRTCQRLFVDNVYMVYTYATQAAKVFNVPPHTSQADFAELHRHATALAKWTAGYIARNPQATLDQIRLGAIETPIAEPVSPDDFLKMLFGATVVGSVDRPELTRDYCKLSHAPNIIATFHDKPNCVRQRTAVIRLTEAAEVAAGGRTESLY